MNVHLLDNNNNNEIIRIPEFEKTRNDQENELSLWDIYKTDITLVWFLRSSGFFLKDANSQRFSIKCLYIWLFILFTFSAIGFSWYTFYFGSLALKTFFVNLDKDTVTIIYNFGSILFNFVVPPLQACGISYSIYVHASQSVYIPNKLNNDINTKTIIQKCKHDAIRFFILNTILVIAFFPLDVIKIYFDDDDSFSSYLRYTFDAICSSLLYYFLMVNWLSVSMFLTSTSMMQTHIIQKDLIDKSKEGKLTMIEYINMHDEIINRINHSYYAVQYVTVGALINGAAYMWLIWSEQRERHHYGFIVILENIPFFFKELIFFFYVLDKATYINTLADEFYIYLAKNSHLFADKEKQFELLQIQCHSLRLPISFKLTFYRLSRRELLFALISFIFFITYLLIRFSIILNNN